MIKNLSTQLGTIFQTSTRQDLFLETNKLVEDMNARPNVTDAEIQTAQRCMIQTAQDLLRQGKIEI